MGMNRTDLARVGIPLLLAGALIGIAAVGYWMKRPPDTRVLDCPDPVAGCTFMHRNQPVRLRLSGLPIPMQAFDLSLVAPGVRQAHAQFQMIGMEMGFNRYDLRPAAGGVLAARITLPICVSGRRDWMLSLEVDGVYYSARISGR